jgi:hypothetical protein
MFFSGVLQYVWPDTPIRRSSRLASVTSVGASTELGTSSSSDQHAQLLHEEARPRPPDSIDVAPPQILSAEVYLLLVDFPPAPSLTNLLDVGIGDADPAFVDFNDVHSSSGRSSSCEDLEEEYQSDEHEFHDAPTTLEDMLWPAELLHNLERMGRPVHHHRERTHFRQSQGTYVEERGMSDNDLGDHRIDRSKSCMFQAVNDWSKQADELHAWEGGTGVGGLCMGASMMGPCLATPAPSFLDPGPAFTEPAPTFTPRPGCADPAHVAVASA